MKHVMQFILALSIIAIPQSGHAFAATNGLSVEPVNDAVFEVNDWRGSPASAFWCAAANYARRELKADWKRRVFIARTMGPSVTSNRGSAVHFTIDQDAAGVATAGAGRSLGSFVVGDNMTVQQANGYCQVGKPFFPRY